MTSRAMVTEIRMAQWAEIISDKMKSGMNVNDYCASAGLTPHSYYYWQRKLRDALLRTGDIGQTKITTDIVPRGFTEVSVYHKLENEESEATEQTGQGVINIEISGMNIRADRTYPIANLAELLKMLVQR